MSNVVNEMLKMITVSLPEEFIWVVTCLVLLKRFDLLDKYRWEESLKWIMIPVLLSTLSINILKYVNAPRIIISLTAVLTIYIGIIYILKSPKINIINEKIPYLKTFLFVLLVAVLIILIESIYLPFFIVYIKKSITEINNSWSISFLLSIPARLIQFAIILLILSIQNRKTYSFIIQSIFSEKKISLTIISFVSILIVFWVVLIDIFGNYNVLSQFNLSYQILLDVLLFVIPSILLVLMIYLVVLFIEKINQLQKSHQNMFDMLDDDL